VLYIELKLSIELGDVLILFVCWWCFLLSWIWMRCYLQTRIQLDNIDYEKGNLYVGVLLILRSGIMQLNSEHLQYVQVWPTNSTYVHKILPVRT
jgi:hypothetical protein